mmetsp:Transcript_42714/g.87303  ORF Transcript_42714/g.87303 Transcript_42714/m.87303 type:complete len:130 (+) Transcript_42714:481-870(+)
MECESKTSLWRSEQEGIASGYLPRLLRVLTTTASDTSFSFRLLGKTARQPVAPTLRWLRAKQPPPLEGGKPTHLHNIIMALFLSLTLSLTLFLSRSLSPPSDPHDPPAAQAYQDKRRRRRVDVGRAGWT